MTRILTLAAALMLGTFTFDVASAEVRFGDNVRIGGHDVSNRTFDENNRGEFHIYENDPANPGCQWRQNADGSRTQVCHLKRRD